MNPWDNEPNEMSFDHSGLPCRMKRNSGGAWCGYVGVDRNHPLHGCGYSDESQALAAALERRMNDPVPEVPGLGLMISALSGNVRPTPENALDVHGGVTWSDRCAAGWPNDDRWWFGFDCAHAGDLSPKWAFGRIGNDTYRDMNFARAECCKLAEQLAALAAPVTA